jgi:hypothetical protein
VDRFLVVAAPVMDVRRSLGWRAVPALGGLLLCVGVLLIAGGGSASAASTNKVLILAGTVTGGTSSIEATEAAAQGMAVDVVDDATWSSMTAEQFASYRAIILGDPTCQGLNPDEQTAAANARTWGSMINGNIVIAGTDPVYHASQGGATVTQRAVDFAIAQSGKTGAYISLSCYYHGTAPSTPVPLLDGIGPGGFTVTGVGCYNNAHIVAESPALAGLTDADLSNWSCSVHEAFQTWPGALVPLAIAKDFDSSYTASDGTQGPPYILAGGDIRSFPLSVAPLNASGPAGTSHTVTAQLLDGTTRAPVVGAKIGFRVTSGPNNGAHGSCVPATCLTDANGHVAFTYTSNGTLGSDSIQAFDDSNGNGIADVGEPQTTAGMTWTKPPTSCSQAGQMENEQSFSADQWSGQWGISKCEGLVVSNVSLEARLMAERMSLPYLNIVTCTVVQLQVCPHGPTERHVVLRTNADEAQSDPTAYTHVQLISQGVTGVQPTGGHCTAAAKQQVCKHIAIHATYRVDLAPPGSGGAYLLVTQRDEFYIPFSEKQFSKLACEPSQDAQLIGAIATPLPDCGRWKPIVTYSFHKEHDTALLFSVNAAARLHFTPDGLAMRAGTFFRDCDKGYPEKQNCLPNIPPFNVNLLETYKPGQPEQSATNEAIVRAYQAQSSATLNRLVTGCFFIAVEPECIGGRYDNLHMTAASEVNPPGLQGAGCPECGVHMHWRWGNDLFGLFPATGIRDFFGDGQPLIADGEPAAQPSLTAVQEMDVGIVAYHSEADQLAPYDFTELLQGAQLGFRSPCPSCLGGWSGLAVGRTGFGHDSFEGGFASGSEPLSYQPGSCYDANHLASWGQCGEVAWLSATSYPALETGDNGSGTFFAFGGFFCGQCGFGINQAIGLSLHPTYRPDVSGHTQRPGTPFSISFGSGLGIAPSPIQIYDVLPVGTTNVGVSLKSGEPEVAITCDPVSTDSSGAPVVHCTITLPSSPPPRPGPHPGPPPVPSGPACPGPGCITIRGNLPTTPGAYRNIVHAVWGSSTTNSEEYGGNLRLIDPITVR